MKKYVDACIAGMVLGIIAVAAMLVVSAAQTVEAPEPDFLVNFRSMNGNTGWYNPVVTAWHYKSQTCFIAYPGKTWIETKKEVCK